MPQLTEEQKNIIRYIVKDISNELITTLGGYAGTGKSTLIRVLLNILEKKNLNFLPCAYTGKAANILRRKGISQACTIHSSIYRPFKDEKDETFWQLVERDYFDGKIDGFIVDEASMVSKEIHNDLCSFGLPIIYIGDHGQLEPIGTEFNLMKDPKYKLEKVHRNAGEIAHFAEHLRQGKMAALFKGSHKVQVVKHNAVEDKHIALVDQVICAYNKTRVLINERARKEKNIHYTYVAVGEKIICLKNNRLKGLFNGMQGTVTKIRKNEHFDFISDGQQFEQIRYDPDQFGQETNKFSFSSESEPFDYAYCITCHKAQGDQFGSLIVFEQRCNKWDHTRWAYTAASRAVNSLIWAAEESFIPNYLGL
jgi:exodeoxyribonuclease-5